MNLKSFAVSGLLALLCVLPAHAQDAQAAVRTAVQSELAADRNDKSLWRYRDEQRDKGTASIVVQTRQGSVSRTVEKDGKPLAPPEAEAEDRRIADFVGSSAKISKAKKDADADDKSAEELLRMLPDAFTWRIEADTPTTLTLAFAPNPNFHPPDMQSRVLGEMAGQLVVDKAQQRIQTISGKLTQDVMIGFGILGRLKQGGTFRVERREVRPRLWQITETHVHIDGKALLFKSIGQQQDEIQSDFTPVPPATTMAEAAEMTKPRR